VSYRGHECQWNGPSWPYATSVTLTALANLLNGPPQDHIGPKDYLALLKTYAKCHRLKRDDGERRVSVGDTLAFTSRESRMAVGVLGHATPYGTVSEWQGWMSTADGARLTAWRLGLTLCRARVRAHASRPRRMVNPTVFPVGTEWQELLIPFSKLKRGGPAFNANGTLLKIEFQPSPDRSGNRILLGQFSLTTHE